MIQSLKTEPGIKVQNNTIHIVAEYTHLKMASHKRQMETYQYQHTNTSK